MKRSSLFAIAIAAALVPQLSRADELADIKAAGKLVCGVTGTVAPFGFQDGQTRAIVGYDVDICAAVAKELGVKAELKIVAVNRASPSSCKGGSTSSPRKWAIAASGPSRSPIARPIS